MYNSIDQFARSLAHLTDADKPRSNRRRFLKMVTGGTLASGAVLLAGKEAMADSLYVKPQCGLNCHYEANTESGVDHVISCEYGQYESFNYKVSGEYICGGCSGQICHDVWWAVTNAYGDGLCYAHGSFVSRNASDACYCGCSYQVQGGNGAAG